MIDLTATTLSETDRSLRDLMRQVVDDVVAPAAAAVDRDGTFPQASVDAIATVGGLGLLIPGEFGGTQATTLQYVLVIEEIARGCAATAAIVMTQAHSALPILIAGTAEQQAEWLPALAAGSKLGAIAFTEPDSGSDLASLRTRVDTDGGAGGTLNGSKMFITNGHRAEIVCVLARVGQGSGKDNLAVYVVDGSNPGLYRGKPLKKMGIHGSETVELAFTDIALRPQSRLGREGEGWQIAMRTLEKARLSTAAQAVGIAQSAYERALDHAQQRQQFGKPIFDFQAVQFRLADMAMQIESARALLHRVAQAIDAADVQPWGAHTAMAKVVCSDMAMRVTTDAVQTLGGYGYMEEYGVERLMRDAKITQIYDGTNDINRLLVARGL